MDYKSSKGQKYPSCKIHQEEYLCKDIYIREIEHNVVVTRWGKQIECLIQNQQIISKTT